MIDFNRPAIVGKELTYIKDAVDQGMLCGDGKYTKLCSAWMKERFQVNQVFLTTSCTHALEMAAFLCDIEPGDEGDHALLYLCIHSRRLCAERSQDRVCGYPAGYHEYG